ncbi:MAG TPA: right-handed parallel beta-helix repeat-containing protein [Bryobacteraceae bacterium]
MIASTAFLAAQTPPPTQINISEDLTALGIASQNAIPDTPGLDTRPLLTAAIQYASANGVGTIIADPGAYWFLTPQLSDRYLVLNQVSNLTIDFHGSDLYLQQGFLIGFDLENCQNVTLEHFTIDYVQLPFTQVKLSNVSGRTLTYSVMPGWPSPTTLVSPTGSTNYWGLVLRGGMELPNTNRLPLAPPANPGTLQVLTEDSPWTQPSVLSTYQAGDIAVVTLRDGDAPIFVEGGDAVTLEGIDVYASGTLGVHMDGAKDSIVSRVRVMPRPGTDRLISTNADGIHMSYIQSNNRVRSCYINRTMDDGIALNSMFLAVINKVTGSRTITATRYDQTTVPNGTLVAFLNPATGQTYGSGLHIASQNPPYGSARDYNPQVTYTFDGDLPALQNGFGLIYGDPANRGRSTIVEKNIVEDVLFARGIFLGGVSGITVQNNVIRRTNCAGIAVHQDLAAYPSAPNQNIQIVRNTVDSAIGPAAVGTGAIAALGSIFVLATDSSFIPLTLPTALNITISNNYISNAGRTGIWAGNMSGGAIQGNTVASFALYPQLAVWGVTQTLANQLAQDFTQSLVLRASTNVNVGQNQ